MLDGGDGYDWVGDTPPTVGLLTINALVADIVRSPVSAEDVGAVSR